MAQLEAQLLQAMNSTLSKVQAAIPDGPASYEVALAAIKQIRGCAYEDLNQLQHEALLF